MRDRTGSGGLAWAVIAGLVLVGLRSAVLVFCEGANFDSDQAVFGLMAKHLAEWRAFPLTDPGVPWTGSLDLHGRMPVASIRLEAQAPSPVARPSFSTPATRSAAPSGLEVTAPRPGVAWAEASP